MRKLALIRKNTNEERCPFGLPIPFGCKHAGKFVENMAPFSSMGKEVSEDEKDQIADANVRLFAWELSRSHEEPEKCPYATVIMDNKEAVECNFEDTAPGVPAANLVGAPFYSQVFTGSGGSGLYSYPVGYYADYNTSRNLFFGMYSLQGSEEKNERIRKIADEFADSISINRNR
jgi:hypothetical protein